MSLVINDRAWMLAERLYIHCYNSDGFSSLLMRNGVEYKGESYNTFSTTSGLYGFMSEESYSIATFMKLVPTYKYIPILKEIVFDSKVIATTNDKWNYFGEYIRIWYPELLNLLTFAGITIDSSSQTLIYDQQEEVKNESDYLLYSFSDPYLDYIRKEINEAYKEELYLSVMFLSRKMLEVCVIRVMEVVFPKLASGIYNKANHQLWYDLHRGRNQWFEILLDNLKANANAFDEDRLLILELVALVKPFKNETNACVHIDYRIPEEKYIRSWRIPEIILLARKAFKKYCNP